MKVKIIERVRKAIPPKIARKLWVKSGGRCEYDTCNIPLWRDSLTQSEINKAYISHIIAAKENGPRGDSILSETLEVEYSNLMLLCDECHNRIDESEVERHTVDMLREMKRQHEERIEIITEIKNEKRSQIVLYKANIGEHSPPLNYEITRNTLVKSGYFPSSHNAIELGLDNSYFRDRDTTFWNIEVENLKNKFNELLKPQLFKNQINHISLFGIAPIPLLVKLGTLINDIQNLVIYQPHRNPKTWEWLGDTETIDFQIIKPSKVFEKVAINLSISGAIVNERIHEVLGNDCSIYTITVKAPYNDVLRNYSQFLVFQPIIQKLLNEIKVKHGQNNEIHVFPAIPAAFAIELGRVRMPKADLPFIIYDQIAPNKPFIKTLKIE